MARLAVLVLVPSTVLTIAAVAPAAPARAANAITCPASPVGVAAPIDVTDAGFEPIAPLRIADTRVEAGPPQVGEGCVLQVDLAAASPPAEAVAVALTVTSDRAAQVGYVSAYGCGSPRTETSVLNPDPALPSPNLVVVPVDTTGRICLYTRHATDLIVDVTGWFVPDGDRLREMAPARVLDTRSGTPTNGLVAGKLTAGSTVRVPIADYFIPGDATGVAATITITNAEQSGWVTAYPCGTARPATSVNNVVAGRDRGVAALLGLGQSALCLYTDITTDLIVDITGCFCPDAPAQALQLPNSPLATITSQRVADSRQGVDPERLPAGVQRRYDLASIVPPGTTAAALNVTATDALAAGYLTVYLCDAGPGQTSSVNFARATTETTLTTIGLGDDADVCVYTSADVHVIIDLFATLGFPSTLRQFVTTPELDREVAVGQRDHTVRCAQAGSTISVTVAATSGARVSVSGGTPSPTATWTGLRTADQLVPITVTGPGANVEQHYLRCLPHDFPDLNAQGASPTPGWYVAASLQPGTFAFILDEFGVPVWYKRTPYPVVGVFPQANGDLAWRQWTQGIGGFPPLTPRSPIEIRDLNGDVIDTVNLPDPEVVGWHDMVTLPNGNRVVTAYPRRPGPMPPTAPDTCRSGIDGTNRIPELIVDSEVIELDPNDNVVWRWNTADHTTFAESQMLICFDVDLGPGEEWAIDLAHINAVDVFPNGDYLIDMRHMNALYRVRPTGPETGDIIWKLGGSTRPDGTSLAITNDPLGGPFGPHDGRVNPDGSITMHDNHVTPGSSTPRAVRYTIDETAKTATLTWSYTASLNQSTTLGSVRLQPDGNYVIGWGAAWQPWLEEVTPDHQTVLRVDSAPPATFYRVVKLAESTYQRDALRALAGGTMLPVS